MTEWTIAPARRMVVTAALGDECTTMTAMQAWRPRRGRQQ